LIDTYLTHIENIEAWPKRYLYTFEDVVVGVEVRFSPSPFPTGQSCMKALRKMKTKGSRVKDFFQNKYVTKEKEKEKKKKKATSAGDGYI
jgi:hypothetical protein